MKSGGDPDASRRRRTTLLVALGLLVYLGGLVPEVRWQLQRSGMRRTMVTMRELGNEIAEHHRRTGSLPGSLDELGRVPAPVDGFGNAFHYTRDAPSDRWTLLSMGADGREQGYQQELFMYMDCDIVFSDAGDSTGQFTQSPEGIPMGTILGPGWSYAWFKPMKVMYGAR